MKMADSLIATKAIEVLKAKDKEESRTYTITSKYPEMLDAMEGALAFISYCSGVGHSTGFKIEVDGDGRADIKVLKDGKPLKWDSGKSYPDLKVDADGDIESVGLV